MMSKRHYNKAEKLLRHIAKINKRTFDEEAFEQLKNEEDRVYFKQFLLIFYFILLEFT